ncbi:MAG TPA: nucleotide sugar dehydrogenase [Phycisphaerales bacterium]|nr:nucleotide sugar dehydrogenase [Phycisphaerales bacterium]
MTPHATALIAKFESRRATVGVVGLGYVGLPLVRAMHEAGFAVVGFDIDPAKIDMLRRGEAYLKHLGDGLVKSLAASPRFRATCEPADLATCDAVCLCVPTPLGKHQEPDLSYVEKSARMVAGVVKGRREPLLVSLESTTYPGTTREVVLPILREAVPGDGLFVAFSPEREDPGRAGVETKSIPRLVGGVDEASTRVAAAMYGAAVEHVHTVASAEVAEAAKLLENIYRAVNIALVNELKPVLRSMGIDIWQVIDAAATKPFGFQKFTPGPGLGGHCIPIDPFYLTWRAREFGHTTRFIELAGQINHAMPLYVVEKVAEGLNGFGKSMNGADVLVLGVAYKPDIDDVRETPAAEILELLLERGCRVSYHDPHVPRLAGMRKHTIDLSSEALTPQRLGNADAVVVVTDHKAIDWAAVGAHAKLVIDSRNAMARVAGVKAVVVKA